MKDEMHINENRTPYFKKNSQLERVLEDVNSLISSIQLKNSSIPEKPIILIMGCARCGSTLLMQYLSSLDIFSYPSNLVSRFYKNPYLGIKIQQALLEFDPSNQLGFEKKISKEFDSNLGKTTGALAPSEFWYFWRDHFKFSRHNYIKEKNFSQFNSESFLQKLSSFEILTSRPLVMKGMIMNWNIPLLQSIYPKFIFINLKRDHLSNAKSLLNARTQFFNDEKKWYSFKPLEFEKIKDNSPIEQVVGQVYYTQKSIELGLEKIPAVNQITTSYESFCQNPHDLLKEIKMRFNDLGNEIEIPDDNHKSFRVGKNQELLQTNDIDEFNRAISKYD